MVVVYIDGALTHFTQEIIDHIEYAGVFTIKYVAHSTHILQPIKAEIAKIWKPRALNLLISNSEIDLSDIKYEILFGYWIMLAQG